MKNFNAATMSFYLGRLSMDLVINDETCLYRDMTRSIWKAFELLRLEKKYEAVMELKNFYKKNHKSVSIGGVTKKMLVYLKTYLANYPVLKLDPCKRCGQETVDWGNKRHRHRRCENCDISYMHLSKRKEITDPIEKVIHSATNNINEKFIPDYGLYLLSRLIAIGDSYGIHSGFQNKAFEIFDEQICEIDTNVKYEESWWIVTDQDDDGDDYC